MSSFLHQLANRLLQAHGNDLSNVCVVMPSRRAGVFFRKALGDSSTQAIWAPAVQSIEDFVMERSGLTAIDKTTLLFRFYQVYERHAPHPQPIAQFAAWAGTYLADINEIDLNLLDAQAVFHELYSVERITRWNPDGSPPTDFQKRHLAFVQQFGVFYTALRADLLQRKEAYQGMAFRTVAENIDRDLASQPHKQVVFAGFNALTASEERIMQAWQLSTRGSIFWDMDTHYVADPMHEAGHYMRKYLRGDGALKLNKAWEWQHSLISEAQKQISVIAVQRKVTQAKVAAFIIARKLTDNPEADLTRTAIVLTDEQLLIPLLHALPTQLRGVNITMGYGLQFSQSAVCIQKLFTLWENTVAHGGKFYHRDLAELYQDTFFAAITGHEPQQKLTQLLKSRKVSLPVSAVDATSAVEAIVFQQMDAAPVPFLQGLGLFCAEVRTAQSTNPALKLEMEFLYQFEKIVTRLSDLLMEFGAISDLKTLHVFWRQLVRGVQLDFKGEPLSGLQIMGMLETRNLDFDEVIMLGVNEGNLPSTAAANSYLTHDIRGAYGLARQNERDAVTAYHFYRLMQRAQKVTLIYDQDTDAMGKGEMSRYVRQLQLEKGPNVTLSEFQVDQQVKVTKFRPTITITKEDTELQKLHAQAATGFSPSALNTYRNCALRFYFSYVAGFKEQKEFAEHIDHANFGTAVHDTLHHLYLPYINIPLTEEKLYAMLPLVKPELDKQFHAVLALDEPLEGRNLLAYEVAVTYVQRVIHHDIETIKAGQVITILKLEDPLTGTINVDGTDIHLKGIADRVDQLSDGTVRIVDYKTGGPSTKVKISDADFLFKDGYDHFFQLLMYRLMYASESDAENVRPMLFYVRQNAMPKELVVEEDAKRLLGMDLKEYAHARLTELFTEILDPNIPFAQTEDEKRCAFCDFTGICQR